MNSSKIFLFLFALCMSVSVFAQQKPATFIEVDGGASLPLGNWGGTATASSLMSIKGTVNDVKGWANVGGFGAVDGAWFFSSHFGVGGMFKFGTNGLKKVDSLSQGYEESFDVDTTRTTPTHYTSWSIMPGIYYMLSIAKKFDFTARALLGITHASTPQITCTIEDGGVFDAPIVQYSASKIAPSADIGAGLSYNINKCVAIALRADYFYTKPDFTIRNAPRLNNAGREIYKYDQPLESVNFSLGVVYRFRKKK
jgi:outer membrane protein with beta-barrel domain